MISGILFDKDGTLFDFQLSWSAWAQKFLNTLANGDAGRAADLGRLIGFDTDAGRFAVDSFVIAGTNADIVDALLPALPGVTADLLLRQISLAVAQAPMAEAVPLAPLLGQLRALGLRLGVATNDSEVPARAHLDQAGILAQFDYVSGADSGHGAKPGPGMCLAFAEAFALPAERVVMVGDSLHDLHAGRAAGMRTVGVLTGMADAATLTPHADIVLPDIGALPAWLAAQGLPDKTTGNQNTT